MNAQSPAMAEFYFDFNWDNHKLWALEVPSKSLPMAAVAWHLDVPIWSSKKGQPLFDLTPNQYLARISHRFLLNGVKSIGVNRLCQSAENTAFVQRGSAETSKLQARDAALSLRAARLRAQARARRGSCSALPPVASRICEITGFTDTAPYPHHTEKLRSADVSFVIDMMWSVDRYVILDGVHRLVKLVLENADAVVVRKIPRRYIPNIKV
jgi:hypothetical protein